MVTLQCRDIVFQNIHAVLFDKDGTLADSASFLRSLGQKRSRLLDAQVPGVQDPLLMAFGIDGDTLNPAGLMAVGTRYENEIAAAAYVAETGRGWLEALEMVRTAFREADGYVKRKADHTPLFQGAKETLEQLAAAGVKVGILSSDSTANVEDFVRKYQLEANVQLRMGTNMPPAKPDPALFHRACETLAVTPDTTLLIGDSGLDLKMARAAGAAGFVAVGWNWTDDNQPDRADVQIDRFDQIRVVKP